MEIKAMLSVSELLHFCSILESGFELTFIIKKEQRRVTPWIWRADRHGSHGTNVRRKKKKKKRKDVGAHLEVEERLPLARLRRKVLS